MQCSTAVMLVGTFGRTQNVRQQRITIILTLLFHLPSSHGMKVKVDKEEYMSVSLHQQTDPEVGQSAEMWTASALQHFNEHFMTPATIHLILTICEFPPFFFCQGILRITSK